MGAGILETLADEAKHIASLAEALREAQAHEHTAHADKLRSTLAARILAFSLKYATV
jgi:hypothetical protein